MGDLRRVPEVDEDNVSNDGSQLKGNIFRKSKMTNNAPN